MKRSITDLVNEFYTKFDKYSVLAEQLKSLFAKFYIDLEYKGLVPTNGDLPKHILRHEHCPTDNSIYSLNELLFTVAKKQMFCQCSISCFINMLVIGGVIDGVILGIIGETQRPSYELGANEMGEFVKFNFFEKEIYSNYLEIINQAMDKLISEMERAIENFEEDSLNLASSFVDKYYVKDKH